MTSFSPALHTFSERTTSSVAKWNRTLCKPTHLLCSQSRRVLLLIGRERVPSAGLFTAVRALLLYRWCAAVYATPAKARAAVGVRIFMKISVDLHEKNVDYADAYLRKSRFRAPPHAAIVVGGMFVQQEIAVVFKQEI